MNDNPRSRRPDDDDRPRRPSHREEDDRSPRGGETYGMKEEVEGPRSERGRESSARRDEDRPRRSRDEDEDDRPRRSRLRDEEYEEPAPRRRKRRSPSIAEMDMRTKLFIGLGVAALVGVGLIIGGIWWLVRTAKRAPFQPHMTAYLTPPTGAAPPGTPITKMVVVDVADKDIDGLHFDLPDNLRAATPEEATTVVWLSWNKRQVGTYSTGGNAYQWFCDVTVIDLKTKGKITGQNFTGSAPPTTFMGRRGESKTGDKPTDAVLNYLKGLRR